MPRPRGRKPDDPISAAMKAVAALTPDEREEVEKRMADLEEFLPLAVFAAVEALNSKPGPETEDATDPDREEATS